MMSALRLRVLNTLASVAVVAVASGLYALAPYNASTLQAHHGPLGLGMTGHAFLATASLGYMVLLGLYFGLSPAPTECKSLRFWRLLPQLVARPLRTVRGWSADDRLAVLSTLLKAFFAPMMAVSLMGFCLAALNNLNGLAQSGILAAGWRLIFDKAGFWIALQLILFVDVLLFTVGYLVESRRLGNVIRSVDPTWLGWAAALLCYPPFNELTGMLLGSQHTDFPQFEHPAVHLVLNALLLLLLAGYTSASVALGLKASNLTHRGIVSRGPYAFVRHPAYTFKSMAWWIGSAPLVGAAFDQSLYAGIMAAGSVIGWTALYVLRALTEEDHLRRVDGSYGEYAQRVRWRFIPGVI